MDLTGKTVVLTGASRGIGVYIARALARAGANLALAARSEAELGAVCAEIENLGVRAIAVRCDVVDAADRTALIERATAELGPVDVLVNNAGIELTGHFHEANPDDLRHLLEVNLTAPLLLTRAVLPAMVERGSGHVVNIASAAGRVGPPYLAPYAASKHGLVGMTHSLRAEYTGTGVGFSVVCPGFVTQTGMYERWVSEGVSAPKLAGSSKADKVASVVVDCIRKNRAEVLVNTPPIKPLVVLATLAPAIGPRGFRIFGYTEVLREAAENASVR